MPRNESDERSIINKLKLWLLGIIGVVLVAAGIALIALGGQYTSEVFKSHFLTETGIALLPVGLMSLVYEFVLSRAFASEIRELLAEVLSQNFTTQFRPLLAAAVNQEFGVHRARPRVREIHQGQAIP